MKNLWPVEEQQVEEKPAEKERVKENVSDKIMLLLKLLPDFKNCEKRCKNVWLDKESLK